MRVPTTPLKHLTHTYRDGADATVLSTIDVWLPPSNPNGENPDGIWIVYIHGGAWRDPLILSPSFHPTLSLLSSPPHHPATSPITGYASLNYRLSPYPSHPTSPSSPSSPSRSAKHPDHLDDVTTALLDLEKRYRIGGRYVLVGHSCGATLAFQLPARIGGEGGEEVPVPRCVVGSEGIYDIPALVERNQHPFYREFVTAAFGVDEGVWAAASPRLAAAGEGAVPKLWEKAGAVVVSHSEGDEYVEMAQSLEMLERVKKTKREGQEVLFVEAVGRHDEVHEKGGELARVIEVGVRMGWVAWGGSLEDVEGGV
ncbi:hypothetical protein VE03_05209 [Pseudogymnoascus sp. 23342-1-I1]|nr:hypothetical protein VE03_05209 [Pseudogymnoascus sp. 23342-1-I1]